MRGLLLEYAGTLLIMTAIFYTHGNPILIGLAYTAALVIADGHTEGFFSPLGVLVDYGLGRMTFEKSVKMVAVQVAAALSVILLYKF